MDFAEVRRLTIVALFSDDKLFDQIVLKGGNALSLVYGLSLRTSLDLDFSIEQDFADLDDTRRRIFRAVKDRFATAGFVVFDESFEAKPQVLGPRQRPWWGGYELKFKLIEEAKYRTLGKSLEAIRQVRVLRRQGRARAGFLHDLRLQPRDDTDRKTPGNLPTDARIHDAGSVKPESTGLL